MSKDISTVESLEEGKESPNILLVDDHRVTADIEKSFFTNAGFKVTVVVNLQEIKQAITENSFDLLMIDVSFAKETGLEVIKTVKRLSRNSNIKILVTSVVGAPEVKTAAMNAGAHKFLVKPAPRPKILKEIKSLTMQKSRDSERVKQSLAVLFKIKDQGTYHAKSLDVSEDGIHLNSEELTPQVGTMLKLELKLQDNAHVISVEGEVVRHTAEGFGVKFTTVSTNNKRALDKFLLVHSMENKSSQYYL